VQGCNLPKIARTGCKAIFSHMISATNDLLFQETGMEFVGMDARMFKYFIKVSPPSRPAQRRPCMGRCPVHTWMQ
jgi:hypothetical protein